MHVIYLHQYFNTPSMVGSTRSYEIGRRLVSAGHTVDVVTSWREPRHDGRGWFHTDEAGMRVHWLPLPYSNHMSYRERVAAFFRFAAASAKKSATLGGDVVLATSTPLTISLPAAYAARRNDIPMVFEVRDLWPEIPVAVGALKNPLLRWSARKLERFSYANASRIIALSPGMAEGIAGCGVDRRLITVIPNAADLDFFRPGIDDGRNFRAELGVEPQSVLVGYVGTIGKINGVSYLVRLAARLLDDERFHFVVVGDGAESDLVRSLAGELGVLDRNFQLLPGQPKSAIPSILAALDIAVSLVIPVPELEMNSANKFFDALAAGRFVALNYGGWQAELLRQCDGGIRLSADPAEAAAQLRQSGSDVSELRAAGRRNRQLAEREFSRDVLASQVESTLREAVDAGEARR